VPETAEATSTGDGHHQRVVKLSFARLAQHEVGVHRALDAGAGDGRGATRVAPDAAVDEGQPGSGATTTGASGSVAVPAPTAGGEPVAASHDQRHTRSPSANARRRGGC